MDEHESLIYIKSIFEVIQGSMYKKSHAKLDHLTPARISSYSKTVVHVKYHWHPKKHKAFYRVSYYCGDPR